MDHLTEPSEAVRVSVLPFPPTTMVVGDTLKTPGLGGGLLEAELDAAGVDGAGELGRVLALDGGFGGDDRPLLPGEPGLLPGEPGLVTGPPGGDGAPPAAAV